MSFSVQGNSTISPNVIFQGKDFVIAGVLYQKHIEMTPILVLTMEILSKVYILLFSYKHNLLIFNNISRAKFSDVIFKGYIKEKF